jgi:hypothetical protein
MKVHPKETQYIKENLPQLRSDFEKYAYVNLKIKNKQGRPQRLTLNKLQRKLLSIVKGLEDNGKPVRVYVIKSRQTGSTTFWSGWMYWKSSMNSEVNTLLIAHDDEGSEGLQSKFQNFYLRSNPVLKPSIRNMNRKETYFSTSLTEYAKTGDIGLDNHIDSVTAAKKSIGRSYTYNHVLITEFGLFEENGVDVKSMLSSLYQAVPEEPGTSIIIETTAKGEGYAKDYWDNEENGFTKVFISWIADDTYVVNLPRNGVYFDLSSTEDSVYGNELDVYEQIEKEVLYWDNSNDLNNNPAELHHQVMCRIAWRRRTIHKKCQDDKQIFKQEYPLTVEDAFSTSATNVFPNRVTEPIYQRLKKYPPPCKRFQYFHDELVIDKFKKFHSALYGELKVYENPIPGKRYVIGGDGAQGIEGGDFSSLCILGLPELSTVAIFEQIIGSHEFAGCAYWLSKLYNNALLAIELNDKGGYAAMQELENNYPDANLYFQPVVKLHKGKPLRYGWVTNAITRSIMISDAKNLLTKNYIQVYDMNTLKQLRSFVKHKDGKLAAITGKHDDLVIALMIALQLAKTTHIEHSVEVQRPAPPRFSIEGILQEMERKRNHNGLWV